MTVHKTFVQPFQYQHEKNAFDALASKLKTLCGASDEIYLLGNASVASMDIDAIVLASNSMMVIDFKSYPEGKVQIWDDNENRETNNIQSATWYMNTRSGGRVLIKGGKHANPFEQIKTNRSALFRRLLTQNKQAPLFETERSGRPRIYVSGIVCFTKKTDFPTKKIQQAGVDSWFHVMDLESFSIPKEERRTLNAEQLFAIAQYIHHADTKEWKKAANEPRPRKGQHQSDRSSAGAEDSKADEISGYIVGSVPDHPQRNTRRKNLAYNIADNIADNIAKYIVGSVCLAYLGIGLALWARWIAGFFSSTFDDGRGTGKYTGDLWLFGIADTWLAGGAFNTWSLAWFVSWLATIITLPVIGFVLIGSIALLLVLLVGWAVWEIVVHFVENPY